MALGPKTSRAFRKHKADSPFHIDNVGDIPSSTWGIQGIYRPRGDGLGDGMAGDFHDLPDLAWSPWVPLEGTGRDARLPKLPGLYRIRSVETGRILYIGQTGRSLRERMGALKGVYGDEMPYNDPHTAGPALWAHRIEFGETFEVSVAVLDVDRADRRRRVVRVPRPQGPLDPQRALLRAVRPVGGAAGVRSPGFSVSPGGDLRTQRER